MELVGECVIQLYPTNTVLFKEGEKTTSLWIIKSGRVNILKNLNFPLIKGTKNIDYSRIDGPTEKEILNKQYKLKTIQIDEFGKGEVMGIESFIDDSPLKFTAITLIPTEIIIINFTKAKKLLKFDAQVI